MRYVNKALGDADMEFGRIQRSLEYAIRTSPEELTKRLSGGDSGYLFYRGYGVLGVASLVATVYLLGVSFGIHD